MAAIADIFQSVQQFLAPPDRPIRLIAARRVHIFAAAFAGGAAGTALLASYYATLALLPPATAYPTTLYPAAAWAHRFDLAQFAGTLLDPPTPTPLTWWLGLVILLGTFTALGLVYAVLLAWSMQRSDIARGLGFGAALFAGLGMTVWIANGLHPAIMRNTLPDTGIFLLGWSGWAACQLLIVHLIYGALLGAIYRRLAR